MTVLMYAIAIVYCISSRLIYPFLKSLFVELTTVTNINILSPLTVVVADDPASVKATVKQARRRRTSTKAAAA